MLSKLSVKKPLTIAVAVVLALILGVMSFGNMTTDLLPSMELPYVAVFTTYPGASPERWRARSPSPWNRCSPPREAYRASPASPGKIPV